MFNCAANRLSSYRNNSFRLEILSSSTQSLPMMVNDTIVTGCRRGGRVVQWCWVNFQCRGVSLIWIIVGQGPTVLAVGAGEVCLDIFSLIYLSQRTVKPKTTNQPSTGCRLN